ncbi:MAG: pilus assembly protein CpaF [Magnetospirillum sp.]|nr:pilus assembly protein CpaF [Magnetospirillum sp.]
MFFRLTIDAFALTPGVAEVLKQVRDDRQMAKSRMEVLPGGLAAAHDHYADRGTPQVVIVEEEGDDAALLAGLDRLAEVCESGTRVLVIGEANDIRLYRTLMARGVSDYLLRPVGARQIIDALATLFAEPGAAPKGRVVACWGARGGAGSSTLAQNLAFELGRFLREPMVYADLDLAFGTSVLAFNIDAKQTVADALAHPERLDEVLMERCMVDYDEHLKVLAAPGDCRSAGRIEVEAIDRMLELASRMAGTVVVDLPHQWCEWTDHLLTVADEVVVTAIPDLASLRDCKTLKEALQARRGSAGPRLVLNRMDAAKKTQLTAKDFEETIGLKPALVIPYEPQLFGEAANNGQMIGEHSKAHRVAELFRQLAGQLAGKAPAVRKSETKKGLMDMFRR